MAENSSNKNIVLIAIDGPGGVGKSSVGRGLAAALGYYFFSSGLIYRAMAWYLLEGGWQLKDRPVSEMLQDFNISVSAGGEILLNGKPLKADLHQEEISKAASQLSGYPEFRDKANLLQRETVARIEKEGSFPGVILEGRDIATVVFPEADHKIFITASEEIRARRRFLEIRQKEEQVSEESVLRSLRERDHRDSTREVAPLKPAGDAIVIDTSQLNLEQVISAIAEKVTAPK